LELEDHAPMTDPGKPDAPQPTIMTAPHAGLADFDRRRGFWETAHRVAREAEDRYVEVSGLPTLREETRRTL
jgi:hypothetical protein